MMTSYPAIRNGIMNAANDAYTANRPNIMSNVPVWSRAISTANRMTATIMRLNSIDCFFDKPCGISTPILESFTVSADRI